MKISTWPFLWTVGAFFTQTLWAQQGKLLTDAEAQRVEIESIRAMRSEDDRHLAAARLEEDCVTVSDPADRMLYQHEDTVNRFLAVPMKLGLSRAFVTHYSNPRLASHGGVAKSYDAAGDRWSVNGREYALTRPWGLIGSLDEPKAQAWLFRRSAFLNRRAKNDTSPLPKPEAYPLNRFEEHALSLLRGGEKLVRWENEQVMFAMGAVRADASCVRCHDGAAGDLLGAFTYTFAKSPAPAPDEKTQQIVKWHREGQKLDQMAGSLRLLVNADGARMSQMQLEYGVKLALLSQGIVTAEMVAQQAANREQVLKTDLGPVKKPGAAGAE